MHPLNPLNSFMCALTCALTFSGLAWAGDAGTAPEAEAMVKKAVAFMKANGNEKACEKFTHGKPIIKMFVDLAKEKGKGWVEGYKFLNTVSQKIEGKAMYLERVGDVVVGCGIHKS